MRNCIWVYLVKGITTLTFVLLCFCSFGQSFTIKGAIHGKDTGFVTLRYFRDGINRHIVDTAVVSNGKFQFDGKVTGAEFASFVFDDNIFDFFIEPALINMSLQNNSVDDVVITGSKIQNEYNLFLKSISKEKLEIRRLNKSYRHLDSLIKAGAISPSIFEKKRSEIDIQYTAVFKAQREKELSYVRKHPDSYVSLVLLLSFVGRLPDNSVDSIYNKLSYKIRGSSLDYKFVDYVARVRKAFSKEYAFDKLKVGQEAPRFTINKNFETSEFSGNNFKDKLFLIEFWGLYCVPCLKANPKLEEIRKKFGKDNLTIIAVNNNNKKEAPLLISYINKNKLGEWVHVFTSNDVQRIDSLIFKGDFTNYEGLAVPRTVLIDKAGKIRYKNYGYSTEEFQKLEELIEKVLQESSLKDR